MKSPLLILGAALAALVVLWLLLAPRCAGTLPAPETNLLVNGDAEASVGSSDGKKIVAAPGWKTSGLFNVIPYGEVSGYPRVTVPGPAHRGRNFFAGGPDGELSSATQEVDVSRFAGAIDGGGVVATLGGWLGGYEGQNDNAGVTAEFRGADGVGLGKLAIGPVYAADRKSLTCFIERTARGPVPPRTRQIVVTMTMKRVEGKSNDGYADDLSLTLGPAK